MATDLFLEMAELPATGSLGTGQLDTRDLLVAGVPISISSKYLYLYLELSGSTLNSFHCSAISHHGTAARFLSGTTLLLWWRRHVVPGLSLHLFLRITRLRQCLCKTRSIAFFYGFFSFTSCATNETERDKNLIYE